MTDTGIDADTVTVTTADDPATVTTGTSIISQTCAKALAAKLPKADPATYCTVTMGSSVSAATVSPVSGATADAVTPAFARQCRTWKQWYTHLSYHEQHVGKFCYDGHDAFAKPWGGYHRCGDWWGIGYTASNIRCFPEKAYDSKVMGGYFRRQWDWVHWSFIAQGVPLSFTLKMHTNIFPSGAVTFHQDNSG